MSFEIKKFKIIKSAISVELADFCFNYFLIKRQVVSTFLNKKHISIFNSDWGTWEDPQVPNTYSHYADIVMETLLLKLKDLMEKETDLQLIPTYSYARIYKKGDILHRHKDRPSCEISTTLNLGGDPWPIFLKVKGKNIKVNLKPGDMLIYKGCDLEHWREKFNGKDCAQVFLHYNNTKTLGKENLFDSRPHLGLPSSFKK
jgi:hypothetical protein